MPSATRTTSSVASTAVPAAIDDLVLLCRRDHVPWHEGELWLRDLRIPWRTGVPSDRGPAPPSGGLLG